MQLISSFFFLLLAALNQVSASPAPVAQTSCACPADKCFSSYALKPSSAKLASSYCSSFINYTPTVTKTSTTTTISTVSSTKTVTSTPIPTTSTVTQNVTPIPVTVSSTCATSTQTIGGPDFPTSVDYVSRASYTNKKRAQSTGFSAVLSASCGSGKLVTAKLSSECACLLGPTKTVTSVTTKTSTRTSTATVTNAAVRVTQTVTVTLTLTASTVTSCQTASTSIYSGLTCGVPVSAYTTGSSITCAAASQPLQTNARFRIEGNDSEGTIFDGPCIAAGPENITTPSGGTHNCDGTNGGANPTPGGTLTTAIDQAGLLDGFDYDGTYDNQFQDFFIERIGNSPQTESQFWGVLRDLAFTAAGGCQEYNSPGDGLWAFDAFNAAHFLSLSSEYAVVTPGQTVSLQILRTGGNGEALTPIAGATFAGATSDGNGLVTFTASMNEGCYQYKATLAGAIRSQAFYLTVIDNL